MEPRYWPTFGQVIQYLTDLGFTSFIDQPGSLAFRHPNDDSWFLFRDRDRNTPAREADLIDMREQLTGRGFVSDEEFAKFWDQRNPRILAPTQPTA
jgi:hypothetical protein